MALETYRRPKKRTRYINHPSSFTRPAATITTYLHRVARPVVVVAHVAVVKVRHAFFRRHVARCGRGNRVMRVDCVIVGREKVGEGGREGRS